MDALLLALKNVCEQILPIAGALVLIYLCVLLKKVWKLIEELTKTIKNLDPTIKLANTSIEKVQAPLDTVVRLSHSVDQASEKGAEVLNKAAAFATDNISNLKARAAGGAETLEEETFEIHEEA